MDGAERGRVQLRALDGTQFAIQVEDLAALQELLGREGVIDIADRDDDSLTRARLVISPEDLASGPIVRFDCKWVRID
jgi:hypothetical protein